MAFIDAYAKIYSGPEAEGWNDMAPLVAHPAGGNDSLLQIYVPAEHTTIDYGAGKIKGIRMASDHHAHMTAVDPLTTISLGIAAGQGVTGGDGLNVFTAGAKTGSIARETSETYHGTKTASVTGAWKESCDATKTEHVTGSWNQACDSDLTTKCKTYLLTTETTAKYVYGGDVTVEIGQNHKRTINGTAESHYIKPSFDIFYGLKNTLFGGLDTSVNVGNKSSIFVGLTESASLSGTVSMAAGLSLNTKGGGELNLNASYSVTRSLYADSKTLLKHDETGALVDTVEGPSIRKEAIGIVSAITKIFK